MLWFIKNAWVALSEAFVFVMTNKNDSEPVVQLIEPVVVPTPAPVPKYLWDTPNNVRHSIRVICDEEGLTVHQKDMVCDIAYCESRFNPNAKLVNSPKSVDRGLFQINGFYHPEATEARAYDPEWNTRWACKAILQKKTHAYWSASQFCWNKGGKYTSII